jgi:hypothetical protein
VRQQSIPEQTPQWHSGASPAIIENSHLLQRGIRFYGPDSTLPRLFQIFVYASNDEGNFHDGDFN